MNRSQELLTVLQEECGEVIQASSKIIRFGLSAENKQKLIDELGDVLAIIKLLDEDISLDHQQLLDAAERKVEKVEQFMVNKKKRRQR